MKFIRSMTLFLCFSLLVSACAVTPASSQLPTKTVTVDTSVKTQPATGPLVTNASEVSSAAEDTTAIPSVQITPTEFFKVLAPLGQFSFLSPIDAKISVMGPHASVIWDNLNLMVGIAYRAHTVEAIDPLTAVDLGILNEIGIDPGQVQVSPGDEITVSGYPVRVTNLSVDMNQAPLKGEALSIILTDHSYLFVFGMQMLVKPTNDWEKDGKMRFQQIARSINFDPNADSSLNIRCDMSTDLEYGYVPDKPIKVGGGGALGKARMGIFINNLLDSQTSSALTIVPLDPIQAGAQILYPWEFTSGDEKKKIYIDTSNFEDPKTPVGITCRGTLPSIELVKP